MKAAMNDFEEGELAAAENERLERLDMAWDYCPHNLQVTPVSARKQVVSFEVNMSSNVSQAHFEDRFCLPTGRFEHGIILKVECLAANILLIESNLSEKHLLQEVMMGFLPF